MGPLFPDQRPTGGSSLTAATVEYRQRFGESFGAAVFVDAGRSATARAPFTGTLFEGVGVGARYYTSLGPDPASTSRCRWTSAARTSSLEAYIGLGQAF